MSCQPGEYCPSGSVPSATGGFCCCWCSSISWMAAICAPSANRPRNRSGTRCPVETTTGADTTMVVETLDEVCACVLDDSGGDFGLSSAEARRAVRAIAHAARAVKIRFIAEDSTRCSRGQPGQALEDNLTRPALPPASWPQPAATSCPPEYRMAKGIRALPSTSRNAERASREV